MSQALADAREFLWRHGVVGNAVDPVELIRDLTIELAKREGVPLSIMTQKPKPKKPKARPKR
jgi:hypothetical protein